jgi:hypothetical protein
MELMSNISNLKLEIKRDTTNLIMYVRQKKHQNSTDVLSKPY